MKRSASRGVVGQLARSDLKGPQRSRKPGVISIRDGELAVALVRGELALRYQPIVDLRSGECKRVEALLRWRHPRLGLLEPGDFLPFASKLIEQIGVWVVRAAAAQWTEWRGLGSGLGIGINVSAPELASVDALLEALAPFGFGAVTFELSPQTFATDMARPAAVRLAAAGARISLDGAGLADAPGRTLAASLDELKISRALVGRATQDPRALADMRSLVELARDYRLSSVAVGIEDRAARDLALSLGCELGQGYFVSRPLVPDRLGPWRQWAAGVALTGSLTLTTFAGLGKAAASGGGQQTPTLVKGALQTACSVDLPSVRSRSGIDLECQRGDRADLYVDDAVAPAVRDALSAAIERDMATVEKELGHSFASRPAVYAFASRTSFAFGLQSVFGVRAADAGILAVANGGITLPRQGAIVINLQNVPNDKDFGIVRHELTHALVHEIVGANASLPAWFDEGLATQIERDDGATVAARGSAVALGILTEGKTTLADLDQQTDWAQRNAALDGQAYSVASEAVRLLEQRVTHDGLIRMLDAIGGGSTFGAAYLAEAGESVADFTRAFPSRLAAESEARIVQTARPDGVLWTLAGFTPESIVTVVIDGTGYHLEYEVRTDKYGMHQGSFGGTAPKGEYTIRASRSGTSATTTIRT
ncbi:MAG TPA: EAL domain-containing protein [Candidatus Bathyarchaeia archaeon]|nr:EAL domain-containing protein [Candidatus Bathyarchaeia archaeon]